VVAWGFTPRWTLEVVGRTSTTTGGGRGRQPRGDRAAVPVQRGARHRGRVRRRDLRGRKENDYSEYRAFVSYTPGKLRLTLDAIATGVPGGGLRRQEHVPDGRPPAGYQILSALQLSGTLVYTKSPLFEEDLTGMVRLSYDLAVRTGGKK
jgi:hypothetical protein